jgi:hypothetical protein
MPRVLSVHEYEPRTDADLADFEAAVRDARANSLLDLPGLENYYLLKGIKGAAAMGRSGSNESRAAWEVLWGPPDDPVKKPDYPENWRIWEDEVLAPYLREDPDAIRFTSYREVGG